MDNKIERRPTVVFEERDERDPDDPDIGKWYWVKDDDGDGEWLGCVVHVGSNYVVMEGPSEECSSGTVRDRIHFDKFWEVCRYELEPKDRIAEKVKKHQSEFNRIMSEVERVTGRLGVSMSNELTDGDHTQALAVRKGEPIPEYRKALAKAEDEELPELFREMGEHAEMMASWMRAEAIPLSGQKKQMETALGKVNRRIFAVDLYAGFSEEAVEVRSGEPADLTEPVRLFQRRHYMDEESLARYEAGGMDYKGVEDFDRWLARDENMGRLLPFSRCIVAFQVRRHGKERHGVTLSDFIRIAYEMKQDRRTFLYIRNGDQLWRISTSIDFGERLFPDVDEMILYGQKKLWMDTSWHSVRGIITDKEYGEIVESDRRRKEEHREKVAKYWADKVAGKDVSDSVLWYREADKAGDYVEFNDESVYYDDAAKMISNTLESHNRVATVIQGILDRSPVLSPHPPWKIWTDDGFNEALKLIYDMDKVLVSGEKPDFEVYRRRLNASLKVGSITVGQRSAWRRKKSKDVWTDNGPARMAKVDKYHPKKKACTYKWERGRVGYKYDIRGRLIDTPIPCHIQVPTSSLLNVDAYTPGDYRIFFDDPRTREEYLKWAPLMLMAEDYKAGKREADGNG